MIVLTWLEASVIFAWCFSAVFHNPAPGSARSTAHPCLTHLLQLMSSLVEFLMAWIGHVRLVKHLKWAALRRPQEQNLKTAFYGPECRTFIGLPTSLSFWCQRILTKDVGQVVKRVSECGYIIWLMYNPGVSKPAPGAPLSLPNPTHLFESF